MGRPCLKFQCNNLFIIDSRKRNHLPARFFFVDYLPGKIDAVKSSRILLPFRLHIACLLASDWVCHGECERKNESELIDKACGRELLVYMLDRTLLRLEKKENRDGSINNEKVKRTGEREKRENFRK